MWGQVHFGGWVWGIEHTSLPHSLLFVSFTPVLLACGAAALGQPISLGEILGTALGVGGSVLLLMDVPYDGSGHGGVSLAGDAASLLASLAFIGYITAGMNTTECSSQGLCVCAREISERNTHHRVETFCLPVFGLGIAASDVRAICRWWHISFHWSCPPTVFLVLDDIQRVTDNQ